MLERLDVKQEVYRTVDAVRKAGSIVSSNTSTIPLRKLVEGLPESFARDFLITHFFNPPRYMRLLEIVSGPATDPAAIDAIRGFADVAARQERGRLQRHAGVHRQPHRHLLDRDRDATPRWSSGSRSRRPTRSPGKPFGFPKTGIFGLLDLVGIDLGPHVAASLLADLPAGRRSTAPCIASRR